MRNGSWIDRVFFFSASRAVLAFEPRVFIDTFALYAKERNGLPFASESSHRCYPFVAFATRSGNVSWRKRRDARARAVCRQLSFSQSAINPLMVAWGVFYTSGSSFLDFNAEPIVIKKTLKFQPVTTTLHTLGYVQQCVISSRRQKYILIGSILVA